MNIKKLWDLASREPVLGFGAIGLSITAYAPTLVDNDAKKAAIAGVLLYLQRVFSQSKKTADERVSNAQQTTDQTVEVAKYVGAVEHQAVAIAGRVLSRPLKAAAQAPTEAEMATAPAGG